MICMPAWRSSTPLQSTGHRGGSGAVSRRGGHGVMQGVGCPAATSNRPQLLESADGGGIAANEDCLRSGAVHDSRLGAVHRGGPDLGVVVPADQDRARRLPSRSHHLGPGGVGGGHAGSAPPETGSSRPSRPWQARAALHRLGGDPFHVVPLGRGPHQFGGDWACSTARSRSSPGCGVRLPSTGHRVVHSAQVSSSGSSGWR